jgi:hypothetical protein
LPQLSWANTRSLLCPGATGWACRRTVWNVVEGGAWPCLKAWSCVGARTRVSQACWCARRPRAALPCVPPCPPTCWRLGRDCWSGAPSVARSTAWRSTRYAKLRAFRPSSQEGSALGRYPLKPAAWSLRQERACRLCAVVVSASGTSLPARAWRISWESRSRLHTTTPAPEAGPHLPTALECSGPGRTPSL